MHSSHAITLFAATALASPLLTPRSSSNTPRSSPNITSLHAPQVLSICDAAPNCETYPGPHGTAIRFIAGKEPGSAWYTTHVSTPLSKRDASSGDGINTYVTYGGDSLNYGSVGASGVGGAIHHLYDTCHEGACDTNDFSIPTTVAGDTDQYDRQVVLHAQGAYGGWTQRNVFVEAMVAAAATGEQCVTKKWVHGYYGGGYSEGSVHQCTQSNFISITRTLASSGALAGFVNVKVDNGDTGSDWCSVLEGLLGGIATIIGAVPEAAAGSAIAAGFFGAISGACQ